MNNKLNASAISLATAVLILFSLPVFPGGVLPPPLAAAATRDDWKREFDDVCSKTQDAAAFTPDELKRLVERCDALKLRIGKLDETAKAIYLKRLQMCRDLFAFLLESRDGK